MSPFQALYGCPTLMIHHYLTDSSKIASLDESLQHRQTLLHQIKVNLFRASFRMQQLANLHCQDRTFEVGDWVYLNFRPYCRTSVHNRPSQKLAKRYFGPFQILRRIGVVAYQLELPMTAHINPVFNVSLLKPWRGSSPFQQPPLPPSITENPPLQFLFRFSVIIPSPLRTALSSRSLFTGTNSPKPRPRGKTFPNFAPPILVLTLRTRPFFTRRVLTQAMDQPIQILNLFTANNPTSILVADPRGKRLSQAGYRILNKGPGSQVSRQFHPHLA